MGWASGRNHRGREVGYSVEATCDLDGCDEKIDRGLYYVCGGMHGGGEFGCGDYFCGDHLLMTWFNVPSEESHQYCQTCCDELEERLQPDEDTGYPTSEEFKDRYYNFETQRVEARVFCSNDRDKDGICLCPTCKEQGCCAYRVDMRRPHGST